MDGVSESEEFIHTYSSFFGDLLHFFFAAILGICYVCIVEVPRWLLKQLGDSNRLLGESLDSNQETCVEAVLWFLIALLSARVLSVDMLISHTTERPICALMVYALTWIVQPMVLLRMYAASRRGGGKPESKRRRPEYRMGRMTKAMSSMIGMCGVMALRCPHLIFATLMFHGCREVLYASADFGLMDALLDALVQAVLLYPQGQYCRCILLCLFKLMLCDGLIYYRFCSYSTSMKKKEKEKLR